MLRNKTTKTVKQILQEQKEGNRCICCHKKFARRTETKRLVGDQTYQGNLIVVKSTKYTNSETLKLWDGESYKDSFKPFCGKACAYKYAQYKFKREGYNKRTVITLIHRYSELYNVVPNEEGEQ